MAIAKGLLSEDDYLLQEILFNPRTPGQVANIRTELKNLLEIIEKKDAEGMKAYLTKIRKRSSKSSSPSIRFNHPLQESSLQGIFLYVPLYPQKRNHRRKEE